MPRVNIRGTIIPNNQKRAYEWYGWDATCPNDVEKALTETADGEILEVYVDSPGGSVPAGSDIYTMLREAAERVRVELTITGQACSAASVIAMAGYCRMSPTALLMVHCASSWTSGNHRAMEQALQMLNTADRAICTAYVAKTGMSEEDALNLMEQETWLTAEKAKSYGLIDEVMFENNVGAAITNAEGPMLTDEQIARAMEAIEQQEREQEKEQVNELPDGTDPEALRAAQIHLDFLNLKNKVIV